MHRVLSISQALFSIRTNTYTRFHAFIIISSHILKEKIHIHVFTFQVIFFLWFWILGRLYLAKSDKREILHLNDTINFCIRYVKV